MAKGLDLSTFEGQRCLLWIPSYPDKRVFTGARDGDPHVYRIHPHKLDCRLGGGKHDWQSWGRDFANHGIAGIVEVDVHVCSHCLRDKR